jgi:hypothetical protein
MNRQVTIAFLAATLTGSAALAQPARVDIKTLPASIKALDWKGVDWAATGQLERTRALMLMDDTLDELGAQLTAEADLMSEFIEQAELGDQFAAMPPAADPPSLTMQEAQKVAVALLRGPMAQSAYATQIADATGNVLTAYEQMYTSTCNRKWSTAVEARDQVRTMTRFLDTSGKMADYAAWVPGEVKRRAEDAKAEAEAKRAALLQQKKEEQLKREEAMLERQKQQFEKQQTAAVEMQQALSVAQQSQPSSSGSDPYYYAGGAYLGAAAYGTGAWYRNDAYRGAATARTERRMSGWRGGRRR